VTRIALTQPLPRGDGLARRLRERGHQVAYLPMRRLVSTVDQPEALSQLGRLAVYDWVVFVSPGAIDITFDALISRGLRWPAETGIGLIGPGSAQALAEQGFLPDGLRIVHPAAAPYDADALLRCAPFDEPAGLNVLVIAGTLGRRDWLETLRERGAEVQRLVVYHSEALDPDREGLAMLADWANRGLAVVFSLTVLDAVERLDQAMRSQAIAAWAHRQQALAPHPRIVRALIGCGWSRARLIEPGEQALVGAIESS
jgi:uroporphyrinogen-III synthase